MSSISPLSSNLLNLLSGEPLTTGGTTGTGTTSFSDIFSESLNTASLTDTADKASALELLTGQSDDMSGMLLDAQKAEIALNLTIQIRNRLVDAYNEMLRMQV